MKLRVVLFVATLVLMTGCVNETPLQIVPTTETVPVKIGALAAIGSQIDGVKFNSVRIIAVNVNESGRVDFNRRRTDEDGSLGFIDNGQTTIAGDFIITLHPGTYDFYVVINEESASLTDELEALARRADLAAIKLYSNHITDMTDETVLCIGTAMGVRIREETPGNSGQVSLDGGTTWGDKLNTQVSRAATKLSVMIRKNTDNPADSFTITDATLTNVPDYSYLLPHSYDGGLEEVSIPVTSGAFITNQPEDNYTAISEEYIMPEYLLESLAPTTNLSLKANYTVAGDATYRVEYAMPLLGEDAANYNMVRNKHYIIAITITECGAFEYTPFIEYAVGDWDVVAADYLVDMGGKIITSYNWASGTQFEQGSNNGTVLVRLNGSATFEFSLLQPEGARWKAYLSNDRDFYLSGDTEGLADTGTLNRITIRPAGEFDSDDITTEFYIIINNGTDESEWDFINDEEVGLNESGERYVIKYAR